MTSPAPTTTRRPGVGGRRFRLGLLVAVVGPGLLAGLSDDDPAGITTYSVLGAQYGYQLLWVLLASTVALILFHTLAARMGVVTGQGLIGLVRDRYGVRLGSLALLLLVTANIGTACAEFAGVAAGFELFGVSRHICVPVAAVVLSVLVLKGSFRRVEHVLMALSAVFVAYIAAGVVVGPDWGAAARGLVVPSLPVDGDALLIVAATIGTTLAPWGLSFIQSYAVDKRLTPADLRYERVDVVTGSVLTGVVGFFVVVTSAATLHAQGTTIETAADAASALVPLAGRFAGQLFGVGLVGAALLAAAVLPLSTAYSVCEFTGHEGAVDDGYRRAPMFYGSFVLVVLIAAGAVLLPGLPLVQVLVLSQVLNTVLLVPLLVFMWRLGRDPAVMGEFTTSRGQSLAHAATIVVSGACVIALLVLTLSTA